MPLNMKMSILIVDDSGTMRGIFKQMLSAAGFDNFSTAEDGLAAIEVLKKQGADLILSDWNMPRMDGLEFLKWVKGNDQFKNIPVIMATAQGDKSQQELARSKGSSGHITKPFSSEQIKEIIEEVFGGGSQQQAAPKGIQVIEGKPLIRAAHIQITDHLALGVLKYQIETGKITPKHFQLETRCMPGWNPVEAAIEKGDVDCAFILAPIAMDLFAFDVPIKLVLFAHKNGSAFIRNKKYAEAQVSQVRDYYKDRVVDIPHKMSLHNMLAHKYLRDMGLKPGVPGQEEINVRFEVIPPIQMPGDMRAHDEVAGFIVAEPIASNAVAQQIGDVEVLSSAIWKDHPCCVVTMRNELIEQFPDAAQEFVTLLVEAGKFIKELILPSAVIAMKFLDPKGELGLTTEVLKKVLSQPDGITMDDLYPVKSDLETIQQYMHKEMKIGKLIDIDAFVETRFADVACT